MRSFVVAEVNNDHLYLYSELRLKKEKISINNLKEELVAIKHKDGFSIYIVNLNKKNLMPYFSFGKEPFIYENTCYCIEINENIIIKDYDHFLDPHEVLEITFKNLKRISDTILKEFNINMHIKKVLSVSGLSMLIYKQSYDVNFEKINKKISYIVDEWIRPSFMGGRSEIIYHRNYTKKAYSYDVNSMYGYIMKTRDMPINSPTYCDNTYFINNQLTDDFFGFLEVDIVCPENTIYLPILPIKTEKLGIIFPKGLLKGKIYFSEELKLALKHNYVIKKIYGGYKFDRANLFKDYVDKVYSLRKLEANPAINSLYKKLINSLYGRLSCIFDVEHNQERTERHLNIAVSSAIASYSRIHLYTISKPYHEFLLYWDTDSIFITTKIANNLLSNNIGDFKLVDSMKEVIFLSTKFYMYQTLSNNYIFKLRGIPLNTYTFNFNKILESGYHDLVKSQYDEAFTFKLECYNDIKKQKEIIPEVFYFKRKPLFIMTPLKKDILFTRAYVVKQNKLF